MSAPIARALASTIVRAYDVRGIVGKDFHREDANALGRALATMMGKGKRICVAWDGRTSSKDFAQAFIDGLVDSGARALVLGLGPTPMGYFALHNLAADACAIITGSHNPPEYNGIKLVSALGPIYGDALRKLAKIAATGAFLVAPGTREDVDVMPAYVRRLAHDFTGAKDLRVAWDAGNGAGGPALTALIEQLPGEHVAIYTEVDGRFPHHHPDPSREENLADLKALVAEHRCDVGIALDGDADRVGVVDHEGVPVWGDELLAYFAEDVLTSYPGATVLYDVKCRRLVFDRIKAAGGRPLIWATGHSLIKAQMRKQDSPISGELSGHIMFADRFYGADDGLYCAVRLLSLLRDKPLAAWRAALPASVVTPELWVPIAEDRKAEVMATLRRMLASQRPLTVDGVRVDSADGWWLIRASNTQAVLVVRAEGHDTAAVRRLLAHVNRLLGECGLALPASALHEEQATTTTGA
ncbi:MAG: phosphomannomutase/phosphoglucomutase [Pseudomonadota bacterium]